MTTAAIIIPHYNDVTRLLRCLEALVPQLGEQTEVIVVDNGSSEDMTPVSARYPQVRVVTESRKGAAAARNRGVLETQGTLIFFLDADCVPDADWVATAFEVFAQGDLVGGAISVFDETPPPRSGAEAFEAVFAFHNGEYVRKKGFSVTANLVTRRAVFDAVGPFIVGVSEDVEWCRRAVSKGFRLSYADTLRVSHPSRSDWPALRKKWLRMTHEGFGVNGHSPRARLRWALLGVMMVPSIFAHAPRVVAHPGLNGATERTAALATLARLRAQRMVWMLGQALLGR